MSASDKAVLIVDDEEGIREGLAKFFRREGYEAASAATPEEAIALAEKSYFAAAVLDVRMGGRDRGVDLLSELRSRDPDLSVVMVTGYGSVESAVRAMKDGASDYILKPIDNERLLEAVRRSIELSRLRRDNAYLRRELIANVYSHDIVTRDPRYLALIELADRVKDSEATVLLSGESGTGKEVMARYIHFTGGRRDKPFVSVNCAALSETLLLSELFGHEKGSFTGAVERRFGKFELAHRGTLFLDEIGDMSPQAQSKFLRVLEESSFERVGGAKRIEVDIRVIAASNKDLPELIRRGEFRSDLYYRINIVNLRLPPLRERRGDIPPLVEHFIAKYAAKYNRPAAEAAPEVVELWSGHDWPGNVRELQNAVNQAVLLCRGRTIDLATLAVAQGQIGALAAERPARDEHDDGLAAFTTLKALRDEVTSRYERRLIAEALARNGGNKSRTAAALDVTRKTLAEKMALYGIDAKLGSGAKGPS
ncbi:MAG: sigma-54 dependent transcriptional regulator [Spirochaetaceae bacterium]|nr:sigma-54 dependent transcriptional regulator [Spirochaetaceae bacterium]